MRSQTLSYDLPDKISSDFFYRIPLRTDTENASIVNQVRIPV